MNELLEKYNQAIQAGKIKSDPMQLKALDVLQNVYNQLIIPPKWRFFSRKPELIKGAYLYGPVGTGKTFLMDLFFEALPIKEKIRMHFYQFMEMMHQQVKTLEGVKNPLKILAKNLVKKTKVIFFDEFFVVNIVDAMLLGNLFQALYDEGITLIATSNVIPNKLYEGGLQREQFVPAIKMLEKNNAVVTVDNGEDYRIAQFEYDRAYFYPQDPDMADMVLSHFKQSAGSEVQFMQVIMIQSRKIQTLYMGDYAIWFEFEKICGIPRSQLDYLEISKKYAFVYVSKLRQIKKTENDLINNFIKLVDVFYDAHIRLIISASVPLDDIYMDGDENFTFERTKSRLLEMQSKDYLDA